MQRQRRGPLRAISASAVRKDLTDADRSALAGQQIRQQLPVEQHAERRPRSGAILGVEPRQPIVRRQVIAGAGGQTQLAECVIGMDRAHEQVVLQIDPPAVRIPQLRHDRIIAPLQGLRALGQQDWGPDQGLGIEGRPGQGFGRLPIRLGRCAIEEGYADHLLTLGPVIGKHQALLARVPERVIAAKGSTANLILLASAARARHQLVDAGPIRLVDQPVFG